MTRKFLIAVSFLLCNFLTLYARAQEVPSLPYNVDFNKTTSEFFLLPGIGYFYGGGIDTRASIAQFTVDHPAAKLEDDFLLTLFEANAMYYGGAIFRAYRGPHYLKQMTAHLTTVAHKVVDKKDTIISPSGDVSFTVFDRKTNKSSVITVAYSGGFREKVVFRAPDGAYITDAMFRVDAPEAFTEVTALSIDELDDSAPIYSLSLKLSKNSTRPAGTGGSNQIAVEATVVTTSGGLAAPGQDVRFSAIANDGSGGHNHSPGGRPVGVFNSASCITDATGKCSVNYKTTVVAGVDTVKAVITGNVQAQASADLKVEVPGLVQVPSAPSYRLTGQRAEHPSNHFMDPAARKLVRLADDFFQINNVTLGLNDMSLASGGIFDLKLDWNGSHYLHRIGRSVDIDHCVSGAKGYNSIQGDCGRGLVLLDKQQIEKHCAHNGGYIVKEKTSIHCELK